MGNVHAACVLILSSWQREVHEDELENPLKMDVDPNTAREFGIMSIPTPFCSKTAGKYNHTKAILAELS